MSDDNNAWYRKYRSLDFDSVAGNSDLKKSCNAMLESGHYHKVILLVGPSGSGKTTIARILGKAFNCTNRKENGHACDACPNCLAANKYALSGSQDDYTETGIREVDLTAEKKVAFINQILDEDLPSPGFTNYTIHIYDECHMMTSNIQNRLLKTLEEPPAHMIFILATTNPEKLKDTILTRCILKLTVSKPTVSELADRLATIYDLEGITYTKAALKLIAKKSNLTPRDTLSNAEICASVSSNVSEDTVISALKLLQDDLYYTFMESIQSKNLSKYMVMISKIKAKGIPLERFLDGLLNFLKDGIFIKNNTELGNYMPQEIKSMTGLIKNTNSLELLNLLDIVIDIKSNLNSNNPDVMLLLLGYKLIYKKDLADIDTSEKVDSERVDVQKQQSIKNFNEVRKPTESSEEQLLDVNTILQMYGK